MKKPALMLAIIFSLSLVTGTAFAFTCPALIKAANESIAKAEEAAGKISGDREKGRALGIVQVAKDLTKQAQAEHKEAGAKKNAELHYSAEAKAKAAKAIADQVK